MFCALGSRITKRIELISVYNFKINHLIGKKLRQ